jgi:hypothetical protein
MELNNAVVGLLEFLLKSDPGVGSTGIQGAADSALGGAASIDLEGVADDGLEGTDALALLSGVGREINAEERRAREKAKQLTKRFNDQASLMMKAAQSQSSGLKWTKELAIAEKARNSLALMDKDATEAFDMLRRLGYEPPAERVMKVSHRPKSVQFWNVSPPLSQPPRGLPVPAPP